MFSSSAVQFLYLIQRGVRSMRKHEVHLQSQRDISCVQQELSSSVGANHRHCLLVKAHLQEDSITTNTSDRKLTLLAVTWFDKYNLMNATWITWCCVGHLLKDSPAHYKKQHLLLCRASLLHLWRTTKVQPKHAVKRKLMWFFADRITTSICSTLPGTLCRSYRSIQW